MVGPVRPTLLVFMGAVVILLVVAGANVTNLLVARGTAREKELAVRAAIGASRLALFRLLATEGFVLAVAGGVAGLVVAAWAADALLRLMPNGLPRVTHVGLDARVLGFTLILTLAVGMLAPLVPALRAMRLDLASALKQGHQPAGWRRAIGLRGGLVVTEVSTAFLLAIGAGLLARSFSTLLKWEPGFERAHVLTFWTIASTGTYRDAPSVAALFARVEGELRSLPGVTGVGMASSGRCSEARRPASSSLDGAGARRPPAGRPLVRHERDVLSHARRGAAPRSAVRGGRSRGGPARRPDQRDDGAAALRGGRSRGPAHPGAERRSRRWKS